ncbi:MAG: hypothetical protein QXL94_01080 [Candidatus Parvarchaeum sp.]
MKGVLVFIRKGLLARLTEDKLELLEFIARLHSIFGSFERVRGYEPFKDLISLKGEVLVGHKIPARFGMLIGLKKLANKYGADNFTFVEEGKTVGLSTKEWISFDGIEDILFEAFKEEEVRINGSN